MHTKPWTFGLLDPEPTQRSAVKCPGSPSIRRSAGNRPLQRPISALRSRAQQSFDSRTAWTSENAASRKSTMAILRDGDTQGHIWRRHREDGPPRVTYLIRYAAVGGQ